MALMRLPLWLKIAWTLWLVAWVPVYWHQYGLQNFLFFCDLGNFLIAIGLWSESTLIFSWQATGLLLFQTLYAIDLIGAVMTGRHFIGGTEYMFNPLVPWFVRALSLFHVVVPPLLLWAIWRLGYDSRGWRLATVTTWIVLPINYFWRPQFNVNWARGLFFREQQVVPGWLYLAAYLLIVPVAIYWPTHLILRWWISRFRERGRVTSQN
ncbi:MAG TPA: hypothetical protein VEI26_12855 [Terriglobales bacterium]|nr:hypothetical protein [Terriglobales bacterium]